MVNYIVGHNVHGHITVNIDDNSLINNSASIVIVVDNNCNDKLSQYYNTVRNILKVRGNLILIGVDDGNTIFNLLASLMTSYGEYNIYKVMSKDIVTAPYLKTLKSRTPDFAEVQSYIGGDVTAYSEINTIMIGLDDLVQTGSIDALPNFLSKHVISIESLISTIEYMKTMCDQFNSQDLINKLNKIDELANKYKDSSERYHDEAKQLEKENIEMKNELVNAKKEVVRLSEDNEKLKENSENNGAIISSFKTINTQIKQCKIKNIVYFKEVSYVPYTNTLVVTLMECITKQLGKKVKLVVYDNKSEFLQVYNPLYIANGKTYLSNKENLLKKVDRFVVSEPIPTIIEDLLLCDNVDVLIIYDRMKTAHDIVEGNNVTKFVVLNSKKEWRSLANYLKMTDENRIITRGDSEFSDLAIKIPTIANYKGGTVASKESKYVRLANPKTGANMMQEIFKRARLIL